MGEYSGIFSVIDGVGKTTAAKPKADHKPKGPQPLSFAAAKFATEKLLEKKAPAVEQAKHVEEDERRNLLATIIEYYNNFPYLEETVPKPKKTDFAKMDIAQLNSLIAALQTQLSVPWATGMCEEIVFGLLGIGEKMYTKYVLKTPMAYFGDITGLVEAIRTEDPDFFKPEIVEITIRWKNWLQFGPYARLVCKLMKKATEHRLKRATEILQKTKRGEAVNVSSLNVDEKAAYEKFKAEYFSKK